MNAPDLTRLEPLLGDLAFEGEIARTAGAAVHGVRLGRLGDRPLALKVALSPAPADELARFRHEARLLSEVRHPNVVEVYEVGVLPGGFPFLVMERLEPYRAPERPGWDEVYDLGLQAAAGLAHVHHHRVVHLDLKPGNLGTAAGPPGAGADGGGRRVKILDFGLACDLRRPAGAAGPLERAIRGTLAYTAPEVLLQDRYDHRADLYSLGLTLLEIATGFLPSAGGDEVALRYHLTGRAADPRELRVDMPEALAAILERLLRRDPGERFASAGRLLEALGRASGREVDPGALALGAGGVLASRLVGRREVVDRLSTALAAARRGEGRALCLEGPEGAGKTRLLRELRVLAALEGARVAYGRAGAEGGRPYETVLQALGRLGIEVEPAGAPAAESGEPAAPDGRGRFRLFRELSRRLAEAAQGAGAAGGAPLVLLLDDLEPAESELLDFLAADLGAAPVLVVAGRRPGRRGKGPAVTTDPTEEGPAATVLELAPFPREASAELVAACLGAERPGSLPAALRDWVHEASEGLPGRVHQLLGHLIDEGDLVFRGGEWKPRRSSLARLTGREAAEALAWRRLGALAPRARRLLEGAAVLGEPFPASALAELLKAPIEEVWEGLAGLAEQGFLERLAEPEGTVYAVAGSRLRDGLYAALEAGRRSSLHRRLGELLARRADGGASELAADAAEHLWRSGRRAESLPYLLTAARQAAAIHGHAEAAACFGRAGEAAEEAGDAAAAFEARSGEARESALAGHPGRALRGYRRLLGAGVPAGAGGGTARARLALELGRLHGRLGEHPAALAAFEEGIEALAGFPDGLTEGGPREPEAGRSGACQEMEPEVELEIELRHGRAVALRDLGRGDEAVEAAREALRRCRSEGAGDLPRQRALLVNTLARIAFAGGDWRRARRLARWGLRGAERAGEAYLALILRNTFAMARWKTGDLDGAAALYGENLAAADALDDPWAQLTAINNLAVLRCGRGDWREARRLLSRGLEMNRRLGAREGEARTRINLGEVEAILGEPRRARRHAERALALLDGPAESGDRVAARLLLAALGREDGELDEADALLRRAMAGAEEVADPDLRLQALLERGRLAAARGELEAAAEDLEAALAGAREAGTRELLGRALIARAELALERGEPKVAARATREALELAAELGDRLSEARARVIEARLPGAEAPLALLERALETFEELGAEPDAEAARRAIAALRQGAGRDSTLPEVMRVINSSLDLREVLDRTMDLALERLGAERGMVVLADRLTRELEVAVARNLGRSGGGDGDEERALSESVVRKVIETEEPVLAVDALTDQRFAGAESIVASHILSILCVPLTIRGRPAGAIYVDHRESRHLFGAEDLEFLRAFADGAAVAIENARLFGELAGARERLKAENESLRREVFAAHHLGSLIGRSRAIGELKAILERLAQSSSTVLIRGESGTGKGLVARILHNVSPRREGPFVHFNCAALPETLVESELFGHEKGAFTGATGRKPGRFELAHGGTVFLDEVGKVSKSVQAKLLRVVEDKEFERVGGTRTQRSDVRIITATNLDLEAAIARDEFREDLYYRLNIIPIVLPPLRERRADIPLLVRHFLERIGRDLGQPPRELDPAVLELFARHRWPGNVRELESAIHRALVLSPREVLGPEDFAWMTEGDRGGREAGTKPNGSGAETAAAGNGGALMAAEAIAASLACAELAEGGYQEILEGFDRRLLESALERCGGRLRETARHLGIARNTLKAKMKRYGLET